MNRRQFTASLAALAAAPAIPFSAARAAPVAIPPGTYAWAQLIARAQNGCSPAMLAQHLRLSAPVADQLFRDMIADGVLRAPGLAGAAQAAHPIELPGTTRNITNKLAHKTRDALKRLAPETDPLANPAQPRLGCGETIQEDAADARPDQSVQESPERG
jgi:hypothetical protein